MVKIPYQTFKTYIKDNTTWHELHLNVSPIEIQKLHLNVSPIEIRKLHLNASPVETKDNTT